ncbi:MAG: ABC transporter permease, partial [Phototrophicales bacterium]
DGSTRILAQTRRVGIEAQMVDPADPSEIVRVNINQRTPVESVYFGFENYVEGISRFNFWTYLRNSIVVTVAATALTLLVNSMAAFALSKYEFRGRDPI